MLHNKIILNLLVASVIVVAIFSCSKDFLTTNPTDEISNQTFWKNQADVDLGLTGCYATLQTGYLGYGQVLLCALTDNCYNSTDIDNTADIADGIITPTSALVNDMYSGPYKGIAACNNFLANVGKVNIADSIKNKDIAQVRFLRAYYYFMLTNFYGGVPLYKASPPSVTAAEVAQSPIDSVLAFINSDLDFAIANLPDVPYSGFAVKGSAEGLKARVALYHQQWQTVVTECRNIMQSGKFSLYNNYAGIFYKKDQNNNPEIMFSVKYFSPGDQQGTTNGLDIWLGWFNNMNPYQELVDAYYMKNGLPITDPASGYDPNNPYRGRDPRLKVTIRDVAAQPWFTPTGTLFTINDASPTGYQDIKYVDTTLLPITYSNLTQDDEDWVVLRYADILLMYAEAENEISGPDASIYASLNEIRARAGMPDVDQAVYNTQATLRKFIRHERRIELAFEGLRYFDLKRWQIAASVMPTVVNPGGAKVTFTQDNYLWPFPQSEIDVNPKLKQNPGY